MSASIPADEIAQDGSTVLLAGAARLVGLGPDELVEARRALSQMGDPARRTVLEAIAVRSQRTGPFLEDLTGLSATDLRHRVRTLCGAGLMIKSRHHMLSVSPERLKRMSQYFDALRTVAALHHPDCAA